MSETRDRILACQKRSKRSWQTPPRNVSVCLPRLAARLSTQRISANQNESTVKTLKLGMIVPTIISLVLRLLFRRGSLPPSKGALFLYTVTFFPAFFLSNYLIRIGTTRRDPTTGTLISYGEDLSQPGVTEWCFDILYVTCKCSCASTACSPNLNDIHRGLSNWIWCFRGMVLVAIYDHPHLCRLQVVDLRRITHAREIFTGHRG